MIVEMKVNNKWLPMFHADRAKNPGNLSDVELCEAYAKSLPENAEYRIVKGGA
jgi:hypothetical protein